MRPHEGIANNPRERCPSCGGNLAGRFNKCQHCGSSIVWVETEAGILPCKNGREAYVKDQVAAVFQQRRIQAEQRRIQAEQQAERERQKRIRTCSICSYTADKDDFLVNSRQPTCRRCARKRSKKILIRLSPVFCVLSILIVYLAYQQHRSNVAREIAELIEQKDYAAALRLDPKNADALSMKKSADIQRALSAGDYAAALRLDPKNADALSMKKSVNIQLAISDGDYAAALHLDPTNAAALAMKKRAADMRQAWLDGDYLRVLELEPNNLRALSIKKAVDLKKALSEGDYNVALRLDPKNAAALSMKKVAEILSARPITNSIGMKLKSLPPGTFMMGDESKYGAKPHEVTLTQSFQMGIHEVTQAQYEQVMGVNPSYFKKDTSELYYKTDNHPVEEVTWENALVFCHKLSELPAERAAGRIYRLPTEAEWEYACRAGTKTKYSFGDDNSDIDDYAWHKFNADGRTHPVGGKQPNNWGFYDMHGNVFEWCNNWHGDYNIDEARDPTGPAVGTHRVKRSSGYSSYAHESANRYSDEPRHSTLTTGFRVVCVDTESWHDENNAAAESSNKNSMVIYRDLAYALAHGDYVRALELDPGNADAKEMKRKDDLLRPPPAIAPLDFWNAHHNQASWAEYLKTPVEWTNSIGMKLRLIPPGTFMMGSENLSVNAKPAHQVTLTQGFRIGVYEVTQEQYARVMDSKSSQPKDPKHPVNKVRWIDAREFCRKLSALPEERAAGRVYRLPSEAEWEYACRAGTTGKYSFGNDLSDRGKSVWYQANPDDEVHPVGKKKPNAWGLYDMHGNVAEWCADVYGRYPLDSVTDPTGRISGFVHVVRGGTSATRSGHNARDRVGGFRVCLSLSGK